MSELINNTDNRKQLLKHMILQLHEGKVGQQLHIALPLPVQARPRVVLQCQSVGSSVFEYPLEASVPLRVPLSAVSASLPHLVGAKANATRA